MNSEASVNCIAKPCIYILIEQFFTNKHKTFLQTLATKYNLILSGRSPIFDEKYGSQIEYMEDILRLEKDPTDSNEYKESLEEFEKYLFSVAGKLIGNKKIKRRRIGQTISQKAAHSFQVSKKFCGLLDFRHIDYVIVSAEYTFLSRPVVIEAKKRNIPVIDIEHGLFGAYDYPEAYKSGPLIKDVFISDYVVVDNHLEAEILKRHYENRQEGRRVEFLPLGTPLDNLQKDLPDKIDARRALDIESDHTVMTLLMSWCEPKSIGQVFQKQSSEYEFINSTFQYLLKTGMNKTICVVIKLHPAIHQFKEYNIFELLTDLAKKYGIENVRIYIDKLDEVIAASDFMISSNITSVLWEGLLAGRPIAYRPNDAWVSQLKINRLNEFNEMVKSGVMHYILSDADLDGFIRRYMREDEKSAYIDRAKNFQKKWGIKTETTTQKSERIIRWIDEHARKMKNEGPELSVDKKKRQKCIESPANYLGNGEKYFLDSYGNRFHLHEQIRSKLKPGWESMLRPNKAKSIVPCEQDLITIYQAWIKRAFELKKILNQHSFSIKDKKILEIGTYGGVGAYAMAQLGAGSVTGTDIAEYFINQTPGGRITKESVAAEEHKIAEYRNAYRRLVGNSISSRVDFHADDICSSNLESGMYDVIVSWEVFEHISSPLEALKQIWRLLKPGGVSFHEYSPFYSLIGGHSLCTLDFLWGHARISESDFEQYLDQIRPDEKEVALNFYRNNLNRMSLFDLKTHLCKAGYIVKTIIPWPEKSHLKILDPDMLGQCKNIKNNIQLADMISPNVWFLIQKPINENATAMLDAENAVLRQDAIRDESLYSICK